MDVYVTHENQNTIDNTKGEKRAQESNEDIWKKRGGGGGARVFKKMVFQLSFEKIN